MTAYAALNGIPCTANAQLLTDILRTECGFDGAVVEDLGAIKHIYDAHHYASSLVEAVAMALKAGCDNCGCGGDAFRIGALPALEQGLITMDDCQEHVQLALQGAREGIVLLKNEGSFLPLDRSAIRRIVLSGAADRCQLGGRHHEHCIYSRAVISTDVSALKGLEEWLAGTGWKLSSKRMTARRCWRPGEVM